MPLVLIPQSICHKVNTLQRLLNPDTTQKLMAYWMFVYIRSHEIMESFDHWPSSRLHLSLVVMDSQDNTPTCSECGVMYQNRYHLLQHIKDSHREQFLEEERTFGSHEQEEVRTNQEKWHSTIIKIWPLTRSERLKHVFPIPQTKKCGKIACPECGVFLSNLQFLTQHVKEEMHWSKRARCMTECVTWRIYYWLMFVYCI